MSGPVAQGKPRPRAHRFLLIPAASVPARWSNVGNPRSAAREPRDPAQSDVMSTPIKLGPIRVDFGDDGSVWRRAEGCVPAAVDLLREVRAARGAEARVEALECERKRVAHALEQMIVVREDVDRRTRSAGHPRATRTRARTARGRLWISPWFPTCRSTTGGPTPRFAPATTGRQRAPRRSRARGGACPRAPRKRRRR